MECLDDNTIAELMGGVLSEESQSSVEAHLDSCPDCRTHSAADIHVAMHHRCPFDGSKLIKPSYRSTDIRHNRN